jgi:hypothetical protein
MSLKAIADLFGYNVKDEADFKFDDFKTHVDTSYILRENVLKDEDIKKKVTGNVFGKLNTKAAQTFGLSSSEVKDKTMEEIFEAAKAKFETQLTEAKASGGASDDERVKKLTKQIEDFTAKEEQYKTGLTDWENKFNTETGTLKGELKKTKLGHKLNEIEAGISFIDDFNSNPIIKGGFKSLINTKYKIDFDDDKGEIVVTDTAGKPVKHPTKTGHFAGYADILTVEAEANNLLKKNNGAGAVQRQAVKVVTKDEPVPVRKIHANAVKAAQV